MNKIDNITIGQVDDFMNTLEETSKHEEPGLTDARVKSLLAGIVIIGYGLWTMYKTAKRIAGK